MSDKADAILNRFVEITHERNRLSQENAALRAGLEEARDLLSRCYAHRRKFSVSLLNDLGDFLQIPMQSR